MNLCLLPRRGIASETCGSVSATKFKNTVRDRRIVTPEIRNRRNLILVRLTVCTSILSSFPEHITTKQIISCVFICFNCSFFHRLPCKKNSFGCYFFLNVPFCSLKPRVEFAVWESVLVFVSLATDQIQLIECQS